MIVVKPSIETEYFVPKYKESLEKYIESVARTCYKSEDKITEDSSNRIIKNLLNKEHLSILEFGFASVKFTTDRAIANELVRHRLCSFAQESTRYCNYSKDKFYNQITVIDQEYTGLTKLAWEKSIREAEATYFKLLKLGENPESARSVLPLCLKTEINMMANFREWRHIIKMRISSAAHPSIRFLMKEILKDFYLNYPIIFDDLNNLYL